MKKTGIRWKKLTAVLMGMALLVYALISAFTDDKVESGVTMRPSSSFQEEIEPGEAFAKREPDVKYVIPEGVSVLMYHMVGSDTDNSAVISEENFRRQMEYLRDHGYHPITLQELYDYVTKNTALPEKPVCITFDDGYADSYYTVYPMMKEFKFPWSIFIITDDVGKPGNRMTWAQLREMAESRTVTIGNHTLSHPRLHNLATREEKEHEIMGAQQALRYHLGISGAWIAYPYGDYDEEVIEICKENGIKLAVTTNAGRVHAGSYPYELNRVYIGNDVSLSRFEERLNKDQYTIL